MIRETTNKTRKTQNSTCAICVAAPAIPVNPKIAAINAMTKNPIAQLNISPPYYSLFSITTLPHLSRLQFHFSCLPLSTLIPFYGPTENFLSAVTPLFGIFCTEQTKNSIMGFSDNIVVLAEDGYEQSHIVGDAVCRYSQIGLCVHEKSVARGRIFYQSPLRDSQL